MSDILIRGMSLPKEGYRQVFITAEGEVICFPTTPANGERRYVAVELPPHGTLIDADELPPAFYNTSGEGAILVYDATDIENAPTIIEEDERWHICNKELPRKQAGDEGYTGYLVYSDGYIQVADYHGYGEFYIDGEYDPDVVAWRPLPCEPVI